MSKNVFWIENPYILFEKDKLVHFVPNKEMSLVEKMNAVTRFCLYGLIIGQLFNFKDNVMYLLCSIIILTIISYKIQSSENEISEKLDVFTDDQINTLSNKLSEVLLSKNNNIMDDANILNNGNKCNSNSNEDESKCVKSSESASLPNDAISNLIKVTVPQSENETQLNSDVKCTLPTKDNPLMNINVGDDPNRPPPCEHTDNIKENINDKFNYNLYRDVDDLFERHNSQRQFYTMPSRTLPNNQTEFAEWLYKSPPTCKENSLCLRSEDKRYHN